MRGRNIRPSSFICLRCGKLNDYGIDRGTHMREFLHIKDLLCCQCKSTTKQVEVRACDHKEEVSVYVPILRQEYYSNYRNSSNSKIGKVVC